VALAAAGAAGAAAAYYVYKYYWTEEEAGGEPERLDADAARASTSGGGGGGVLVDLRDGGAAAAAALDAQAHLQHHFDSIQEIADATTIPSLLPALARALAAADDVDGALAALRAARAGGAPLSQDQKVALWREMAAAALARLAAACWALPLLDLQVRVALSVLGRQLYLEAALAEAPGGGGGGGGGAPLPPRPLSAPSQEAFLAHSEHLAKGGLSALVAAAQPGAAAALAGVPLGAALGAAELGAALSGALEALSGGAAAGGGGGWARFLLPPPPALREALRARRPDNRALLPAGEALVVDAEAVEALLAEKGRVLSSARFQEVATVSPEVFGTQRGGAGGAGPAAGSPQPAARRVVRGAWCVVRGARCAHTPRLTAAPAAAGVRQGRGSAGGGAAGGAAGRRHAAAAAPGARAGGGGGGGPGGGGAVLGADGRVPRGAPALRPRLLVRPAAVSGGWAAGRTSRRARLRLRVRGVPLP
jgi:peroxin-3